MVRDNHTGEWVTGTTPAPRKVNRLIKAQRIVDRLESGYQGLSGEKFKEWCEEMNSKGMANSDAEIAELLGVTLTTMVNYRGRGCDLRTAIACNALLQGIGPYGE